MAPRRSSGSGKSISQDAKAAKEIGRKSLEGDSAFGMSCSAEYLLTEQEELVHEYGALFEGKTKDELEDLAKSFSLCKSVYRMTQPDISASCTQRDSLNAVLTEDASRV